MEDREDRQCCDDRNRRLLAVGLDVLLRLVREHSPTPDVLQHRVVCVGACKGESSVMKHRTVVCGTRGGRRGWETERAVHVTQEEFWDKAETPAKVELAEDVEQAVVFGTGERYFGREVTRPVEICGGVGHGGRLGRGGFFGFGVGGRNALRAETPDGSGSMVFEVGFLELKCIVSG